ncbi:MAG: CHASE2 domain-containing protein [Candidatus Latescibacterota bacterium]
MKKLSLLHRNYLTDAAIVAAILCIAAVLMATGILAGLDGKYYDFLTRLRRSTPTPRDQVVIVVVDQNSLTGYDRDGHGWPWPREFHGRLVEFLSECGAKSIVFDMILSEQDTDRMNADPEGDHIFGDAIAESGRTFLVVEAKSDAPDANTPAPDSGSPYFQRFFLPERTPFQTHRPKEHNSAIYPIPMLAQGAAGFGLANAVLDEDGMVRRYPLIMRLHDRYAPSLGFVVARQALGEEGMDRWLRRIEKRRDLVDKEGNLRLNWYGPGDVDGVFKYYSYRGVMMTALSEETSGKLDSLRLAFRDKIVLVGSNAPGLLDQKTTPVSGGEAYPGVEIHATAIENFLADEFISTVPWQGVFALMAILSALLLILFKLNRNLRLFVGVYFMLIAAIGVSGYFLMLRNVWLPSIAVYLNATLAFVGLITSGYFNESREKRLLRRAFERYVNDSVLEEILANPNAVDFRGRTITATVMATDIENFTNISEKMSAHDLVARLNDYFSEVSEPLINNGAFINKYIGDAILSVYGAFGEPEHRRKACLAAIAAMDIINRMIDEDLASGKIPFRTRFGVNTGEMTMGNIGSTRKIEFTVIGDAVNSAFRLEGINKYYSTRVLVSEFTREGAEDEFEFRLVDSLQFKGKDNPVRIYELLGKKGAVPAETLERRDAYERAFTLYSERRFGEAKELFAFLREAGDQPAEVLESRCGSLLDSPPPEDWNGVWRMFSK